MKKLCFAILFMIMSTSLFAQKGFQMGFRLNPEFTSLLNSDDADAGDELNFASHFSYLSFGVGVLYNFTNNFGVGADLLFSREGQAYTGTLDIINLDSNAYSSVVATQLLLNDSVVDGDYEALAEPNYIKLPLMLSLTTNNAKPLFLTMLVGPQLNFLQGVAQEVNGGDLEYPNTNIEPKDLYKPVTLNAVLALGGAYNLSSHLVLSARLRFDYSIGDVEKKDVLITYTGSDATRFYSATRNNTHSVTEGLLIALDFKL